MPSTSALLLCLLALAAPSLANGRLLRQEDDTVKLGVYS